MLLLPPSTQSMVESKTTIPMPISSNWLSVAYGEPSGVGCVVGAASNGTSFIWSNLGAAATYSGSLPSVANWNAMAFGSGRFVTVAGTSQKSAYSGDGVTWTSGNLGISGDWRTLKFARNQFITIGFNSDKYLRSFDGLTWVSGSMPSSQNWTSLHYDPYLQHYVAVASGTNVIAHSDDGITEWRYNFFYSRF
jgi:hypothetical protein